MTSLGDFQKLLITNFLSKVAQMYGDFFGKSENYNFKQQCLLFGQLLEKFGLIFVSVSGHTTSLHQMFS